MGLASKHVAWTLPLLAAYAVHQLLRIYRDGRTPGTAESTGKVLDGSLSNESTGNAIIPLHPPQAYDGGIECLIGNTPVITLKSLSAYTGCRVLGKLELANPGGSAKDRVAYAIIRAAERAGQISPNTGCVIFEGTSGSTGISFATLAPALGYKAHICLPDDTSAEKIALLRGLGAEIEPVKPASIVDKRQYVNAARRAAEELTADPQTTARGLFADQFENTANWQVHYTSTGPEIWQQTAGRVRCFVTGSGTGGTISGVSRYLKERNSSIRSVVADPQGSGLFNKVRHGVMYDSVEREGTRRRHQVDTLVEGIGLNRVTENFAAGFDSGCIDDAVRVTDAEAVKMSRWLVAHDGVFVGSSSAVNCVAVIRAAERLKAEFGERDENGDPWTIVTILCDSGARHLSKFWNDEVCVAAGVVKSKEEIYIDSLEDL